jgi:hypothetical protein
MVSVFDALCFARVAMEAHATTRLKKHHIFCRTETFGDINALFQRHSLQKYYKKKHVDFGLQATFRSGKLSDDQGFF